MTEWCRETYGIKLTAGTISDCKYDPGSFDIITLWDVLEHTPDPKAMLQECHRLLKRDGLLVINYPDIGSWVARAMGRKWVFLLTVHYYYFTRRTMRGMLAANGWQVVQMAPHWQYLELDYVLARAIPYVGAVAKVAQAAVRASAIGRQMVPYWVGQTLVIARKAK
jgi:ubiquinone/menaquinone biosynthesis C-methylase UbiE